MALSSVASAAHPILQGGQYCACAGLWRKDLERGLMWHCFRPSARLYGDHGSMVAPSWSWASVSGPVEFTSLELDTFGSRLVDVVDVHVTPLVDLNPYSMLRGGALRLRGKLQQMTLPLSNIWEWNPRKIIHWDMDHGDGGDEVSQAFTVLPIGWCDRIMPREVLFAALILEQVDRPTESGPGEGKAYRRIGFITYRHGTYDRSSSRRIGETWLEYGVEEVCLV